jgi:hypothetical protein
VNKGKLFVHVLTVFVLLVTCSSLAHAQATRTWVSGVGDDANPCSRTAPCKTFAGAISKTAVGGEINVLDPGGFGAVTITKAITISAQGVEAGVLVSGTNGIIVSVPNAGDIVILRGLDIEGLGTGINGVTVITGGNVTVENCTINRFTTSGINFAPTVAGSQLHVSNTIIRNNGGAAGTGGVVINASSGKVTLDHVRLDSNTLGVNAQNSSNTSISDSIVANTQFAGIVTAGTAVVTVENSVITHNGTGVNCVAGTTVRLGNNKIADNTTTLTTNTCVSFKNNDIDVAVTVSPTNPQ